jgi:hypothetical protein
MVKQMAKPDCAVTPYIIVQARRKAFLFSYEGDSRGTYGFGIYVKG